MTASTPAPAVPRRTYADPGLYAASVAGGAGKLGAGTKGAMWGAGPGAADIFDDLDYIGGGGELGGDGMGKGKAKAKGSSRGKGKSKGATFSSFEGGMPLPVPSQ